MTRDNLWTSMSDLERTAAERGATLLITLGVMFVIAGIIALASSFAATLATVAVAGIVLVAGGAIHLADAFSQRALRSSTPGLILSVLYIAAGLLLVVYPGQSAAALTIVLAALFLIGGLTRIVSALVVRYPSWGWALTSGIAATVLGLVVIAQWPLSALWLVGTLVGIELLFAGAALIGTAASVRRIMARYTQKVRSVPRERQPPAPPPPSPA